MHTPELRPEGAGGAAHDAFATIGIEADRIRNMALAVPKQAAQVDRAAARIAEAAMTIVEEARALAAPEKAAAANRTARRGDQEAAAIADETGGLPAPGGEARIWLRQSHEFEACDILTLFRCAIDYIDKGDVDAVSVLLSCVGKVRADTDEAPPGPLRAGRAAAAILRDVLVAGYDSPETMAQVRDCAAGIAAQLEDALG